MDGIFRRPMIKCLLLGNSCVGKTSILIRYVDNVFHASTITTLGVDFTYKELVLDGQTVKLQIWDTAGSEQYRTISRSYFRGAQAILLVYDITDLLSFKSVSGWINDIDKELGAKNVCIILVGNKVDLEAQRQVSKAEGEKLAQYFGIPFFETSSKDDINLEEVFNCAATNVLHSPEWSIRVTASTSPRFPQENEKDQICC